MQKKIYFLCILLIAFLTSTIVFVCFSSDFRDGFQEGYEQAMNGNTQFYSTVDLNPKDFNCFAESITNVKSGESLPASLREIAVIQKEQPTEWITIVVLFLIIPSILFFVWLLLSFISNIKIGEIFVKENESHLRWIGIVSLLWGASEWSYDLIEYHFLKATIELEGYDVAFDMPSLYPFIIAIIFFLFAEVFALGRKLKEEQEFTI